MKKVAGNSTVIPEAVVAQKSKSHWVDALHGPITAWVILLISLLITLIAWNVSLDSAEQRDKERFEFQMEEADHSIRQRFVNYEQVLRGGLGLFKASSKVDRDEWHDFIAALEIDKFFPGTQGVGYSVWLKSDQLAAHIEEIKKQGFPDFTVRPPGVRDQYSSIIYLEPFNERNRRAFGFDMYSEPVRREAMSRARDSGNIALSGKVTLVQETNTSVQAGILLYVPHYSREANTVEDRREALVGFIYSALRVGDLMRGILGVGLPELDFSIYDGDSITKENLLYDSSAVNLAEPSKPHDHLQAQHTLTVGDRTWTIIYRTNTVFSQVTASSQPMLIAIGGIIIDLLLFNIILSLSRLRKRAQSLADERMAKLREREQQFKAITDNANDGIISIDEQGRIKYINASVQRLFGYSSEMLMGRPLTMLFPVAAHATVNQLLLQSSGVNLNTDLLQLDGINKSSAVFPLEFSLARWRDGEKAHFTVIVRDITERKKIDEIKNQFISTVSHELRTPLTAISGSLSLVENGVTGPVNDKAMDMIKNARRNATRLATLVNDLLDTEKMASGTMRYDMRECEITELVERALEINQPVATQSRIKLVFTDRTPLVALVDPDRFIQVMTNLLANAIKFSPQGSDIETSVQLVNDEIRVAVTDHGSGIPEEFRSRIFNRFAQADSSDTRKHGGTGLGLSIVKFIIEKFNGRISFNSIPNLETTFYFFLPAIKQGLTK